MNLSTIHSTETELIGQWNETLTKPASVRFLKTRDPRSKDFQAFIDTLAKTAPRVRISLELSEDDAPPALFMEKSIKYHAVPTAGELSPFLEVLSGENQTLPELDASIRERLASVMLPAVLKLYVTAQCQFCPQVVRRVAAFASLNPLLHLTVIDGILFPEMAGQDGARSAPTLILDDQFRWTGIFKIEELLDALAQRDPSRLSSESLKNMLKEGNAQHLAEMMLRRRCIFPAFPDLLKDPDWSVRLGAMVVMEEVANEDREMGSHVLGPLWKAMENADASVKGDILSLFGMLGTPEWVPKLEGLLAVEESAELREVLQEALDLLRHGSDE
jgi:hypothetical protein